MTKRVKQEDFTKVVKPLVQYLGRLYPVYADIWLEELITEAGF